MTTTFYENKTLKKFCIFCLKLIFFYLRERGRGWGGERERHQLVLLIYAFIGCFLCVPGPKTEPATLAYWDDALTNGAIRPGPKTFLKLSNDS